MQSPPGSLPLFWRPLEHRTTESVDPVSDGCLSGLIHNNNNNISTDNNNNNKINNNHIMMFVLFNAFVACLSILFFARLFREHWKPLVRTENQFIYVCHILGPFMPRLYQEKTRILFEVTSVFIIIIIIQWIINVYARLLRGFLFF